MRVWDVDLIMEFGFRDEGFGDHGPDMLWRLREYLV